MDGKDLVTERLTCKTHLWALAAMTCFAVFMACVYATYYYDSYAQRLSQVHQEIRERVEGAAREEGKDPDAHREEIEAAIRKELDAYTAEYSSLTRPWFWHFYCDLILWGPWILLTPAMLILWHRFQFKRRSFLPAAAVHIPGSLLFGTAKIALYKLAIILIFGYDPGQLTLGNILMASLSYWIYVAAYNGFAYYRRFHEREVKANRLEKQLAEAQLKVLKMQLHPHFLFNTLHAVSTLMARDIDAADRMISRLSDLLRLSLKHIDRQEVSLREELDFLNCYLDIEQTRFGERLVLKEEIEPETLDALVPNLILQPIVENAINHGISRITAVGMITLRSMRENRSLFIEVSDNGPGLSGDGGRSDSRVGLANTRARLDQLYGNGARIEFIHPKDGGLTVRLVLPFHRPSGSSIEEDAT